MRYASLFLALARQRKDRVGSNQAQVDATGGPARFGIARKVGIGEQMRREMLSLVANPPRKTKVVG